MNKLLVIAALLALPAAARAGACVYSPEGAEGAPLVCTYLDDEARCAAEAAGHASAEWRRDHPHRFVQGVGCNQAVAAVTGPVEKAGKQAPTPAPAKAPATR